MIWPALAACRLLAWTQALTWMPYGLPGLRVIVTVLWLGTIDTIVLLALQYKASEPVMVAILAPQIPLAYLAARFAVARARRGDVPDWRGVFARLVRDRGRPGAAARTIFRRPHAPKRGSSGGGMAGRCRRSWVILLPFELALLWLAKDAPAFVFEILFLVLSRHRSWPPSRRTVSKSNPHVSDSYGLSPFIATRPLTSAALIAAKLKMAIVEHAGRVAAGLRRHPARARLVGHLARGDRTRAAPE